MSPLRDIDLEGELLALAAGRPELVVLAANARIGQEIAAIPKATPKTGPKKQIRTPAKLVEGRGAIGVKKDARSRLQKLAVVPKPELKAIAAASRWNTIFFGWPL